MHALAAEDEILRAIPDEIRRKNSIIAARIWKLVRSGNLRKVW